MLSRRDFLIRGAAASAFARRATAAESALAACSPPSRSLWAAGTPDPHDITMVLFDRRSAQAVAFGLEAARRGVEALAIDDDAGAVWMHEIAPLWQTATGSGADFSAVARRSKVDARGAKATAIAGLTGRVPLFCLELLGRDYGMRVVYRGQHTEVADGRVRHARASPTVLPRWEAELAEAGSRWGAAAARLALSCRVAAVADSRLGLMDLEPDGGAEHSLFSWVMAPVDSARALSGRRA
jgi:hypothetical protein